MTSNQHCFRVPQCSLWKCQTCSFHLREILSDLLYPLFLSWGACLYRAMFHLNIKASEEVARHFKWHFLGYSQGMWPLVSVLVWGIWSQLQSSLCGGRVTIISIYLLCAPYKKWTQMSICIPGFLSFTAKMTLEKLLTFFWRNCLCHAAITLNYAEPSVWGRRKADPEVSGIKAAIDLTFKQI